MKKLASPIIAALEAGQKLAFVTVVDSSGSTPRKAGSVMIVFEDLHSEGTIGGGAIEYEAQFVAEKMLGDIPDSQTIGYSLKSDETGDVCMICGGDVYVHYTIITPTQDAIDTFKAVRDAYSREEDSWLVCKIGEDMDTEFSVAYASSVDESSELRQYLKRAPVYTEGEPRFYTLPLKRTGSVYIFGGGHVAQEIVPLLTRVDFSCVVYEDRADFALKTLFPDAKGIVNASFGAIGENINIGKNDYVIIVTRGHKADFEVLRQTLPTDALYVGCIGSKRKIAILKSRLSEAGLTDEQIARLKSPIGIQILSETPAEIAVSIAAELILFRATAM
jgi:xanthine dehydrogenase accessory factor